MDQGSDLSGGSRDARVAFAARRPKAEAVKFRDILYSMSPGILYSVGLAGEGSTEVEPSPARSSSWSTVLQ
jgi:hypothetical protein